LNEEKKDRKKIQEYVESTRKVNGGGNTLVVMGAAEGIVGARDMSKLKQIEITKSWARSEWGMLRESVPPLESYHQDHLMSQKKFFLQI